MSITGVGTDMVSVHEWRKCRITTAVTQAHRISHNSPLQYTCIIVLQASSPWHTQHAPLYSQIIAMAALS
jgi:hypothetical protein